MSRRKNRRRFAGSEANHQLRAATVHLEEADHHARAGNCKVAVDKLVRGAKSLARGEQLDSGAAADSGLPQMLSDAETLIKRRCVK